MCERDRQCDGQRGCELDHHDLLRFRGGGSCLPCDHPARSVPTVDNDLANRELHLRSVGGAWLAALVSGPASRRSYELDEEPLGQLRHKLADELGLNLSRET